MRAHPPLQTHFHQPNDTATVDSSTTLKRSMYKKLQLSEPSGKCTAFFQNFLFHLIVFEFYCRFIQDHGADDDLKLLNVIESYWKAKMRQSLNLNVQEAIANIVNKSVVLPQPQKTEEQSISILHKKRENDEKKYKAQTNTKSCGQLF
jgi:hypothetical protein